MRGDRRRALGWVAALLAGCATPPPPPPEAAGRRWSGRLALTVHSDPPQRASALFELRGDPQAGELLLSSPLGQALAHVGWDAGGAWLQRPGAAREPYPDMAVLTETLTGAALPLAALFDWLQGRPTEAPGWARIHHDAATGRLHAQRTAPTPLVDLRLTWTPSP